MPDAPSLPKLADWKAPWEAEGEEFDNEKARKFVYGLLTDKARLQGKVAEVTTERDKLTEEIGTLRETGSEVETLRKANERLTAEVSDNLKLRVALSKGLTEVQAKRLVGSTVEELEKDADELVASFGGQGKDDGDEDKPTPRRQPKRLNNPQDAGDGDEDEVDVTKALESIPRIN